MRRVVVAVIAGSLAVASISAAAPAESDVYNRPVAPGGVDGRAFWNKFAHRFIYAPAFRLPEVDGAASYRFTVIGADGDSRLFVADRPTAALSQVWGDVPEGLTTVSVDGLDASGQTIGPSGERTFYRSPGFSGDVPAPAQPYAEAAREALRAIFVAPHVQHWLKTGKHDRGYRRYCYPNKVMGGLARAMAAYARLAENEDDRKAAAEISRRVADHLIALRYPADAPYPNVPPTYSLDVEVNSAARERYAKRWLMTSSAMDAALALLDVYDVASDQKYLDAATAIADTFAEKQEEDGTWPLVVDWETGEPTSPQRMSPTWVIFFLDRLERQYHIADYRAARRSAWEWIESHPLATYQWDGQFEDVNPRRPYRNLSREQACDVATLLLSDPDVRPQQIAQAEELLRFAEDQFVVWEPVKDPQGWARAHGPQVPVVAQHWMTPCVLEQYMCYLPVARSSAVQINAYLKAHERTGQEHYRQKARALANGLITGQKWLAETHGGNGEIPTWVMTNKVLNWLNNSFYAAEAVQHVAEATAGT